MLDVQSPSSDGGDPRVRLKLKELNLKFQFDEGCFKVVYATKEDRRVMCYIASSTIIFCGLELREIMIPLSINQTMWNVALMEYLLTQNRAINVGAWGVHEIQGGEKVPVFVIHFDPDTDANLLADYLHFAVSIVDNMYEVVLPNLV